MEKLDKVDIQKLDIDKLEIDKLEIDKTEELCIQASHKNKRRLKFPIGRRFFDIILGTFFLLVSAPLIILAAIAVRFESKGNPFFLQSRVGKNGKLFKIVKLRGMYVDAKERFPELYDYSEANKQSGLSFHFHIDKDPRVTKVGQFIRKTSIDELPNFINVVLGQMSMVGPRPEVPDVFEMYGEYKELYYSVKPGVTCVSKCTGRDSLTKEETLKLDMGYINEQNFLGDIRIIWKTAYGVIFRKNVY